MRNLEVFKTCKLTIESIQKAVGKKQLLSDMSVLLSIGDGKRSQKYTVKLTTTNTAFNGVRLWFQCPQCGIKSRCLYIYNSYTPLCRTCLNITYPCRTMHRNPYYETILAPILKLSKLEQQLSKKWLHKEKKQQLMDKYKNLKNSLFLVNLNGFYQTQVI